MFGLLTPIIIGAVARIFIPKIVEKAADQSSQVVLDNLNDELPKLLNEVGNFFDKQTYVTEKLSKQVEGTTINIMDAFSRNLNSTLGGSIIDLMGGSVNSVASNLLSTGGAAVTRTILAGGATVGVVGGGLMIGGVLASNYLMNRVEKKYQENLQITINAIDEARERTISDIRSVVGEVDAILEKRINQVAILVMEIITSAIEIADRFSPEAFREKLIKPTLEEIQFLEKEFFQDLEKQIDRFFDRAEDFRLSVDEMLMGTLADIRRDLNQRRQVYAIPNLLDPCRQKLGLTYTMGAALTDIQVHRLIECDALSRVGETTPIQSIIETYGQLQLESIRMVAISRQAPALKKEVLKDWVKYGMLCDLWQDFRTKMSLIPSNPNNNEVGTDMSLTPIESMLKRINELEAVQKNALAQNAEIDRLKTELTAKTKEIDNLKAELETKSQKIDEIDQKMKSLEKKLNQRSSQSIPDNKGDTWSAFNREY